MCTSWYTQTGIRVEITLHVNALDHADDPTDPTPTHTRTQTYARAGYFHIRTGIPTYTRKQEITWLNLRFADLVSFALFLNRKISSIH